MRELSSKGLVHPIGSSESKKARSMILPVAAFLFLAAALFIAPGAKAASQELFGGALGSWLGEDAQQKLSRLLGSHPRFRGERIRVVAMRDGLPAVETDELTLAIRAQLTHRLSQVKGVQVAWGENTADCGVPKNTPYLLGVEVERESRSRYLVRVAMVDVEEGVWVSGANLQWRGQLTQAEQRAAQARAVEGSAGTIDKPLPARNRSAIVDELLQHVRCALHTGLEGSVHIAALDQNDSVLESLAAEMRIRVLRTAWLNVAQDAEAADWHLGLAAIEGTPGVGESVVATLTSSLDGKPDPSSRQRLAAVYISRDASSRLADRSQPVPRTVASRDLLGSIRTVEALPGDRCYGRAADCVEVGFEVFAPGYVLVLYNSGGRLSLGSCNMPRKASGEKRYRFAKDASNPVPASVYALATESRQVAERIHRTLQDAAGNCGRRSAPAKEWLAALERLIGGSEQAVDWQVFHSAAGSEAAAGWDRDPSAHSQTAKWESQERR